MASWKLKLKGKTLPKGPIAVRIDDTGAKFGSGLDSLPPAMSDYPPSTNGKGGSTQALQKEKVHVPRGKRNKSNFGS
jgi:hypothetical protein